MWRRYGDVVFAAVFALVVSLEAIPLGVLTWTLATRFLGRGGGPPIATYVLAAVGSAAVALMLLTAYILAYQHVSERHAQQASIRRQAWVGRWLRVLAGSEPEPRGGLEGPAVEAMLALRETIRGSDAARLGELLERHGAIAQLERTARRARLGRRLDAIVALSNARIPAALATLVAGVEDSNQAVSVASARAAARTLARVDDVFDRDRWAAALTRALRARALPYGVLEEVVVLSEDAAVSMINALLLQDRPGPTEVRAAIDGVGRLKLLVFAEEIVRYLTDADDEVRAAALRAVSRIGFLPDSSHGAVIAALSDEVDFIRIHAAAAARLLPRPQALSFLSDRLGDRSWWVRRAAADALVSLGGPGLGALGEAARSHPDRYARDMASQALRDHVPSLIKAVVG